MVCVMGDKIFERFGRIIFLSGAVLGEYSGFSSRTTE
jgi:hypothetical protein